MTEPECTQKGGSESGTCAGGYVNGNDSCDIQTYLFSSDQFRYYKSIYDYSIGLEFVVYS